MKIKIERFALGLILATLAPIAGLLGFWWTSYAFLPERWISFCAISGLALGILVDIFILQKLIARAYQFGMIFWTAIFLFYTVGVFGFFMGMPVFNAALAIPAGFIVGGKLVRKTANQSQVRAAALQTCIFTTIILTFICATSVLLALSEATLPAQLEGMLALPFTVTWDMIWGIILVGGVGLLAVNWLLTGLAVRFTHRFLSTP
ncbi:MAG: hypothetical protein IMZ50_09465 [Candidatus Atribacteria bacterium]|nr:hypothetical protein [Candidatus Atribacteria bacterium]